VLNAIRRLVSEGRAPRDPNFSGQSGTRITRPSEEFTNDDVCAFERELEQLYPDNRHVKAKIRQQLQVLPSSPRFDATSRDLGFLVPVGRGCRRLP
jgi:hypothetical protein